MGHTRTTFLTIKIPDENCEEEVKVYYESVAAEPDVGIMANGADIQKVCRLLDSGEEKDISADLTDTDLENIANEIVENEYHEDYGDDY